MSSGENEEWLGGTQPNLLCLGPPLLRFEPNLAKNYHAQRKWKIIEIGDF